MRLILTLAALLIASPAYATGGLWCDINDKNLELSVSAGFNRMGWGNWFNIDGQGDVKLPITTPALKSFKIGNEQLTMRWFDSEKMLLEVQYSPPGNVFELVRITISTERNDEDAYEGSYSIELVSDALPESTDPSQLVSAGDVACSAE